MENQNSLQQNGLAFIILKKYYEHNCTGVLLTFVQVENVSYPAIA